MCWCTPNIRTPNCGKPECHPAANSHQNSHQNSHTQEPWKYTEHMEDGDAYGVIVGADGSVVASNEAYYPEAVTEENQRRIVACVNACKGLPNEVLLKMDSGEMDGSEIVELYKAQAQLATITAQRDELKDQSEYVLRECKEPEALNDESLNICNIATGIRDLRAELEEVIAQRDELLQTVKAVQTMCHGAIRVRIDGIIAKCEVQNDER